jgi:hypothetical protein
MVNWTVVFDRLFALINKKGEPSYFSGPRYIKRVQEEIDPYFLDYTDYLKERAASNESTTRKHYYRDILFGFDEGSRLKLVESILKEVGDSDPTLAVEIRKLMGGGTIAPSASVPASVWNATQLNDWLSKIDEAIKDSDYERAVTLSYSCLEGFFGAFVRAKSPQTSYSNEIIVLSKEVRYYLKSVNREYPNEVLNLIGHVAHAVDKARNRFSESHFGEEAGLWLATYMRDLVNTQIRLLLHFM